MNTSVSDQVVVADGLILDNEESRRTPSSREIEALRNVSNGLDSKTTAVKMKISKEQWIFIWLIFTLNLVRIIESNDQHRSC